MRAVTNKVHRKIRQALVLALTHPAAILATHVAPIDGTRPFGDIRRPDRVATKPSLGPMHGYPKGSLADAAGVPALVDIGRCASGPRIHERDH